MTQNQLEKCLIIVSQRPFPRFGAQRQGWKPLKDEIFRRDILFYCYLYGYCVWREEQTRSNRAQLVKFIRNSKDPFRHRGKTPRNTLF